MMKAVADPVAWMWVGLLGAAGVLFVRRRWRWAFVFLGIAAAGSALQVTDLAGGLMRDLERPYVRNRSAEIQPADAVVVLGGYLAPASHSHLGIEFSDAADRLMTGIALVRDGKGQVLVLGGGGLGRPIEPVEGQLARKWIEAWNLTSVPIEQLGPSNNTHDEAVRTAELAGRKGWKRILLVTSACHMRRAEATFRKAGLRVTPVGCDFRGVRDKLIEPRFEVVPRTQTLDSFRMWAEEQVGYGYYWVRGWAR